jgi:putative ABC transport system permease protein
MSSKKLNGWLLTRLAAQNLARRRLRAIFLGLSVTLAVGVGLACLITGWALRGAVASGFARMGADLVVVPQKALVNLTSSLLTVQPTDETMDGGAGKLLAAIPGVAAVAPQRLVQATVEGQGLRLIAFDPATDFTVLNWMNEQRQGEFGEREILAGANLSGQVGESLSICGQSMNIRGRLGKTGVGPFDESYFVTFAGLEQLAKATTTAEPPDATPSMPNMPGHAMPAAPKLTAISTGAKQGSTPAATGVMPCLPGFVKGRVTAFLLQLAPTAKVEGIKFAISQHPALKVVEGNGVLISSRQGLHALFVGGVLFTALLLLALLILLSLLFSAIVQERYREVGLLRALGATPNQVMAVILAEATMITGLGGFGGLAFGATLLFLFARSLGFYFDSLGVPFAWPPPSVLAASGFTMLLFSTVLGLAGSMLPAWRVRRAEPFSLIQAGGK